MTTDSIAVARGTLLELAEGRLVLGVPGTEYRLHLVHKSELELALPALPAAGW